MFRKHTYVLTRAQLSLSWLQSQKMSACCCYVFSMWCHATKYRYFTFTCLKITYRLNKPRYEIYALHISTWCFSIWWLRATWLMVVLRNTRIHRYTRALHKSCFLFTFLSLVVMRRMLIVLLALASNTMCQVFSSWEKVKNFLLKWKCVPCQPISYIFFWLDF